jgi:hypothetical protein
MQIHKRNLAGVVQITYEGEWAAREPDQVTITATWQQGPRDLGYVTFMPGDRFTEYFYTNHWFNIMRVGEAMTGDLKGWYCNISLPATSTADSITYDDLFLDVWVAPSGATLVLDEEEFAAADLAEPMRQGARAGLAEVLRWVRDHLGPFQELG